MNKEAEKLIKDPFLNWLLVIAYATIIFIFSSMTSAELPSIANILPDWAYHFIEFFIFGVLLFRALFVSGFKKKAALLAVILAFTYGVSDEIHQLFIGRIFSLKDIIVDTIGAFVAQFIGLKNIFIKK